ncbi:hypothetical protein MGN70_004145 [Eutypa lata]|nr:hypothetical protein MGN70_004145 [Eutypa lata]
MAAKVIIRDGDLAGLKGKKVIITGGSSGIGLATVNLLLSLGASVVSADLLPPVEPVVVDSPAFTFIKTDVTEWSDLLALFERAKEIHGRIDHVYANAGISPRANYLSTEVDEKGRLKEPAYLALDVNLKGVINTATLGIYYMRQQPEGGSVVISASVSSVQRFRAVDYATAKHGILGFMRGMRQVLETEKLPIRINAVAPSWTYTGVVSEKLMNDLGVTGQTPSVVARGAALLMADDTRKAHLLRIDQGKYEEIDEAVLLPAYERIVGEAVMEDATLARMMEAMGGKYKDRV